MAFELHLRRSRRARRLTLRVSSHDGRVTLTMPPRVSEAEARAFAEERRDWIETALERIQPIVSVGEGAAFPLEGRMGTPMPGVGPRPWLESDVLHLPAKAPGRAAKAYLRHLARDRLAEAADRRAAELGETYTRLDLRDTRSRWGSCSVAGRLMFSWRLVMAPPEVLDYVAAHEVAHLKRMDHSPAFWGLVEGLCPDWRDHRDWLRQEGGALQAYRFED